MEDAIKAFKRAVGNVPNRRAFPDVSRKSQLKMLRQVEELAGCVLGVPAVRLRKVTGGGWALQFIQRFACNFLGGVKQGFCVDDGSEEALHHSSGSASSVDGGQRGFAIAEKAEALRLLTRFPPCASSHP